MSTTTHDIDDSLDGVYTPAAKGVDSLDTLIPDSMDEGMRTALTKLNNALGGDVSGFVCARLKITRQQLAQYYKAEQVDAIALAIYNIEARHEAVIIGDETGIGKGRQAAGIVRYAKENGRLPIFFTEKKDLFSDFYRDAKDTGIAHYKPLIFNADGAVYDYDKCTDDTPGQEKYEKVYKPLGKSAMDSILKSRKMPQGYDYILVTYSQLSTESKEEDAGLAGARKKGKIVKENAKAKFLRAVAQDKKAIIVLDEAHNAAGDSNTGNIVRSLICGKGVDVVFLSATFAKAPQNLLLYVPRTKLRDCSTTLTIARAIERGGVPLQELISSLLVQGGQMMRRQRDNSKVEVLYKNTDETDKQIDQLNFNNIMGFVRDAISFQNLLISPLIFKLKVAEVIPSNSRAYSIFSYLFQLANALLLAIKAKSVVRETVQHVKDGHAVIIGLSTTAAAHLDPQRLVNLMGRDVKVGDTVRGDFAQYLLYALERCLVIARGNKGEEENEDGSLKSQKTVLDLDYENLFKQGKISREVVQASEIVKQEYARLRQEILDEKFNIPLSPIDAITQMLANEKVGGKPIRVGECTGRNLGLEYPTLDDLTRGKLVTRKKVSTSRLYNDFQCNNLDVLIINAAGATGASAHAKVIPGKVPIEKVRQRVMIIAQPELNVATEMQKRGRINRTGQVMPPIYEYITSFIPYEVRTMMMLRKKLKSLDANTTGSQRQNENLVSDFVDFDNKYGDEVVAEWLEAHGQLATMLFPEKQGKATVAGCANKATGRAAIFDCDAQEEMFDDIIDAYEDKEKNLRSLGLWDLETQRLDYQANLVKETLLSYRADVKSPLGGSSYLGLYECKVKNKPYLAEEVLAMAQEGAKAFGGKCYMDAELREEITNWYDDLWRNGEQYLPAFKSLRAKLTQEYDERVKNADNEEDREATKQLCKAELAKIDEQQDAAKAKLQNQLDKVTMTLGKFYIGNAYSQFTPLESTLHDGSRVSPMAILTSITFGKKDSDKFLPGKIRLRFAVVKACKYYDVYLTKNGISELSKLFSPYRLLDYSSLEGNRDILDWWSEEIRKLPKGIERKYIITGNVIDAFSSPLTRHRTLTANVSVQLKSGDTEWVPALVIADTASDSADKSMETTCLPLSLGLPLCKVIPSTIFGSNTRAAFFRLTGSDTPVDFLLKVQDGGDFVTISYLTDTLSGNNDSDKEFEARGQAENGEFHEIYPLFTKIGKPFVYRYRVNSRPAFANFLPPEEDKIVQCLSRLGYLIELPTRIIPQSVYDQIQADRYNYEWDRIPWSKADIPGGAEPGQDDAEARRRRLKLLALAVEVQINIEKAKKKKAEEKKNKKGNSEPTPNDIDEEIERKRKEYELAKEKNADEAEIKRKRKEWMLALSEKLLPVLRKLDKNKGINGLGTDLATRAAQLRRFIARNPGKRYINATPTADGYDITADNHRLARAAHSFPLATANPDHIIRTLFN